jgi:hypothetical protein
MMTNLIPLSSGIIINLDAVALCVSRWDLQR